MRETYRRRPFISIWTVLLVVCALAATSVALNIWLSGQLTSLRRDLDKERQPTPTPPTTEPNNPPPPAVAQPKSSNHAKAQRQDTEALLRYMRTQIGDLKDQSAQNEAAIQKVESSQQMNAEQMASAQVAQSQLASKLQTQQQAISALQTQQQSLIEPITNKGNATQTSSVQLKEGTPVYNAVFDPVADHESSTLLDGRKTSVNFFIGPVDSKSAITGASVEESLLSSGADVPLSISMDCNFCSGKQTDLIKIIFHNKTQESSQAHFMIIPSVALAQKVGLPTVIFDVRNSDNAVRYDRIEVKVAVEGVHARKEKTGSSTMTPGSFVAHVDEHQLFVPDLVIRLLTIDREPFDLVIEPMDKDLKKLLGDLATDRKISNGSKQMHRFHTYDLTAKEFQSYQSDARTTLSAIMDQQNIDLKNALAKSPDGAITLDTIDFLKLPTSDRDKILSTFTHLGDYLYTRLFLNSSPDLKKLIDIVEGFTTKDGHPLRVLILSQGQAFPWQLLHKPASTDPNAFWGLKYELSVEDLKNEGPAHIIKPLSVGTPGNALFGAYKGDDYPVQYSGQQQSRYFAKSFSSKQVLPANSSTTFASILKENASNLEYILIYTHGSDGWIIEKRGNQLVRSELVPTGQRLIFDQDGFFIRPTDIVDLSIGPNANSSPFLAMNPIILLNACETGVLSSDDFTLPEAFLHLGARGIIATEAPVSDKFALKFGDDLIDQMVKGREMAAAIREVRKKYMDQNNPLGLIYAYYSNDGIARPK